MKKDYKTAIKYATKVFDAWLPYKILYENIPGISVGIVHNGKLLYKKGFGFENIELKKPSTPDTCYRIASISKTFTAIAIMQLSEHGKLNLDDKIKKYLPWFKIGKKGLNSSNITIRQLLSHSAGLSRDGNSPHWATNKFPNEAELQEQSSKSLTYENLTRFKYSNYGFALLGLIIKEVSGLDYDEYVTKSLFKIFLTTTQQNLKLPFANLC
ncbi:MAG: hypothetical protein COY58_04595 [Gammaproteobacteria bacterium CG_4_10_14_0_8_um_filter_38_16]|nr:MAG: hypothetical protein COY58_04595 [Gammaproteobacteria bacterium CG_4_10_14_0_8_um_filter_38_16]PJA03988.1 MAG: hypothetical protein COX72_02335 [Gammaproteobacteria bacterium CG_4_10_14_0_2_um_filter_38_22]PJB11180.1 MAG: hypothetical protein CO120_01030 [Gammaproteobacteria bacterium CG_4_9_14_3_um_filter_38_9]